MAFESEKCIYYLRDTPCFIECTVDVAHWDWVHEGPRGEPAGPRVITVNEHSSGTRVDECSYAMVLRGVSCLKIDLEV